MDLLFETVDEKIDVQSVLHGLALGDALQGKPNPVADQGDVAISNPTLDARPSGFRPELRCPLQVGAVKGELDPHACFVIRPTARRAREVVAAPHRSRR